MRNKPQSDPLSTRGRRNLRVPSAAIWRCVFSSVHPAEALKKMVIAGQWAWAAGGRSPGSALKVRGANGGYAETSDMARRARRSTRCVVCNAGLRAARRQLALRPFSNRLSSDRRTHGCRLRELPYERPLTGYAESLRGLPQWYHRSGEVAGSSKNE
jgi:hypothetical protein